MFFRSFLLVCSWLSLSAAGPQLSPDLVSEPSSCLPQAPLAFSPNGDAVNDRFSISLSCPYERYELQIFDRQGRLVARLDERNSVWEGAIEEQPASEGYYIWKLRVFFPGGESLYREGEVLLAR